MSEEELKSYIKTLDEALAEAHETMLRDKASRGESIVVADDDGCIREIAAKEVLAEQSKRCHSKTALTKP